MNFKEIRKKIEYYEKKHNEAFMICFDHDVNEVKAKMLDDAKDNKEYALAAIYDFCFIYRYANEKEEIKEYLDKHISQLENAKEISEDQKRLNRIYLTILNACLSLQGKDRLNLIKYGTQKKAEHERKDSLSQKKENKRVVNELSEKLLSDYKKYKEDKEDREQTIFHVGTSNDYRDRYISKLTKEEIEYILIKNAIYDALNAKKGQKNVNNEMIMKYFNGNLKFPEDEERYFDKQAQELSKNAYGVYKNAFENTYNLTDYYAEKLEKKINSKLR
jgi:predicted small metal-binding protein